MKDNWGVDWFESRSNSCRIYKGCLAILVHPIAWLTKTADNFVFVVVMYISYNICTCINFHALPN